MIVKLGNLLRQIKTDVQFLTTKLEGVEYFTVGTGTCTGDSYSADTNFEDEQKLIDF